MSVPGPLTGPCEPWIEGAGVAACCSGFDGTDPETLAALDIAAQEASAILFVLSGRQFGGLCSSVARPAASRCGCWGIPASGIPAVWGAGLAALELGGFWRSECGDRTSCPPLQIVTLAPYPVREIVEVKIGGDVLDAGAYRLDRWRELIRTDGGRWPGCQNLALDDDQPSTFSITYRHGNEIPALAGAAAAEVACQILQACPGLGSGECALPDGVVQIARQGITVNRDQAVAWLSTTSRTDGRPNPSGLPMVDLFLHTYWPSASRGGSTVMNVDRRFPRRTPLGA